LNRTSFLKKESEKLLYPCAGGTMRFEPRSTRDLQKNPLHAESFDFVSFSPQKWPDLGAGAFMSGAALAC